MCNNKTLYQAHQSGLASIEALVDYVDPHSDSARVMYANGDLVGQGEDALYSNGPAKRDAGSTADDGYVNAPAVAGSAGGGDLYALFAPRQGQGG